MTRDDVLRVAEAFARQKGWTWREPVDVREARGWGFGPLRWKVTTNAQAMGLNIRLEIDDRSGEVVKANYLPR